MIFSLIITGQPIAKGRPRVTRFGTYTPKKTKIAERNIANAFIHANKKPGERLRFPLICPLKVSITFYFDKPKRPKNADFHIVKPDLDNLAKGICDALNELAWHDDSQIVELNAKKKYVDGVAIMYAQTLIEIETIGDLYAD